MFLENFLLRTRPFSRLSVLEQRLFCVFSACRLISSLDYSSSPPSLSIISVEAVKFPAHDCQYFTRIHTE